MLEGVIRCYFVALPPKGCESILDIGSGASQPYRGILRSRCKYYKSLDIKQNQKGTVDYICDLTDRLPFSDNQWEWGWCTEVIEHQALIGWWFARKLNPVIIGYRNQVVLSAIGQTLEEQNQNIILHYGEGHIKGIANLLMRDGWEITEWLQSPIKIDKE